MYWNKVGTFRLDETHEKINVFIWINAQSPSKSRTWCFKQCGDKSIFYIPWVIICRIGNQWQFIFIHAFYKCSLVIHKKIFLGIVDVSISCLNSGVWEKINITCIPDDDRNLPVKLTGKEWGQHPPGSDEDSDKYTIGIPGIIAIGIASSLLIILVLVLGIFLARRWVKLRWIVIHIQF